MSTERTLTLALVLVAVGHGPGAIPHLLQRAAATSPIAAYASSRSGEDCTAAHESERRLDRAAPFTDVALPVRTPDVESCEPHETGAPSATPARAAFLTPPSERGPPALG